MKVVGLFIKTDVGPLTRFDYAHPNQVHIPLNLLNLLLLLILKTSMTSPIIISVCIF